MKLLAVCLLLVASALSFSITHISLIHHDETLRVLEERCRETRLQETDPLCSDHLVQGLNIEYYFKITRFLSVLAGFLLVCVAVYMIWSAARDWDKTEEEYRDQESKLAHIKGMVSAYKRKMISNKRMQQRHLTELDHYKMDIESAQSQQDNAMREISYLNMVSQRHHVRGRVNWARMIQHRKREAEMWKQLETHTRTVTQTEERLAEVSRENERLNNELLSERDARDKEKRALSDLMKEARLAQRNSSKRGESSTRATSGDNNITKDKGCIVS